MTMNILENIIQRCHERVEEKRRQRRTVIQPGMYRNYPYRFKVYYARTYSAMLDELERAHISFMPIGHAPENDCAPKDFGGARFLKRQGVEDWSYRRWLASWGIQIYTGIPSEQNGARWHDLYFTYEAICAAPDAVLACIQELVNTVANPLLTLSKSGGLRFSCRVPEYLHPNSDEAKQYIYKHTPTPEGPHQREVYLEILGKEGYSRWDGRYEILTGNLLNPPKISKEILFTPIDTLRTALHEPIPPGAKQVNTMPLVPVSLGSDNLDLAKAALLKRGFSYLRENTGMHYWMHFDSEGDEIHVTLWEDRDIVWVRSTTDKNGLPTRAMPITDVWSDTGITYPVPETRMFVTDKMLAVREGELSPLAIKRSLPTLHQDKSVEKAYVTLEEHAGQIHAALAQESRILGIISEAVRERNYEIEPYLREGGEICLNVPARLLAEAVEERYRERNLRSFVRWRAQLYRWEQVKDVPVEERMADPFAHGNPCEDPERCRAIDKKGGHSHESICPKCPVYTVCQQHGYLSQPLTLQNEKAQISPIYQLFINPRHGEMLEQIIEPVGETDRICIIDECAVKVEDLFLECVLPKDVLREWTVSWEGRALGNFAKVLLTAMNSEDEPNVSAITQMRTALLAFQEYEEDIIMQMCHLNVQGTVAANELVETGTGQELARFSIDFEGGVSAYIPLDTDAENRLKAMELPFLPLAVLNQETELVPAAAIEIPMKMTQAIELGILDAGSIETIQQFPTVSKDPNWTFWHQLKHFFGHYKRDADAPIRWSGKSLQFWIPPVLHPRVKRLLLISPRLSERYLRQVFPGEDVEVVHTEPAAWVPGNQVFQIRSGVYSVHTILNNDSDWDIEGLSKMGERFLFGIRSEIDRDPSVKHAIITNSPVVRHLSDLKEKDNVCFVENFKDIDTVNFETADVLWIFGMPFYPRSTIWYHAQMLFGNDDEPLYYAGEYESNDYKDERIQALYNQHAVSLLTQTVGYAGLHRLPGKKVVLLTNTALPNITDRPETLFFDWEDFEVAGGLDTLPEAIATRERFEAEREKLNAENSREEVERVLGCSERQANRVLIKLKGGSSTRVPVRDQILSALADGEKRTSELTKAIGGHPRTVLNVLKHLVDVGEIVRVRRAVYKLADR